MPVPRNNLCPLSAFNISARAHPWTWPSSTRGMGTITSWYGSGWRDINNGLKCSVMFEWIKSTIHCIIYCTHYYSIKQPNCTFVLLSNLKSKAKNLFRVDWINPIPKLVLSKPVLIRSNLFRIWPERERSWSKL